MKRLMLVVILAMGIALFNLGCPSRPSNSPNIMIATPIGPTSGPVYVANEKGFILQENLKATLVPFTSGRLALEALLAGKAEVALVAETPLALAAFQNQKFYIIATITESPHKVVILNSAKVETPKDFKGKKVSAPQGSAGAFWMYSYLKANGLNQSDVTFINLQPTDMVSALIRGDIDAFFAWEPYPYLAQKELGDKVTVQSSQGIYTQTFNVVVTQDFARDNPEALKRLLRALIKAEDFMRGNKAEAISIVAKNSGMEESAVNSIWQDHKFVIGLDNSLLTYLQSQADWAKETKLVPSESERPNYRALIFDATLREVKPAVVNIPQAQAVGN